ncbi:MAG: aspartate kinase [Nanoarchaeota archaeon]|nr:aspartate kinase [Nanoarchaeota archaeon]
MKIMKFGGTSMKELGLVSRILKEEAKTGDVVVVSALAGITDLLIKCANKAYHSKSYLRDLKRIKKIHQDVIAKNCLDNSIIETEVNELEDILKNKDPAYDRFSAKVQSFGERMSVRLLVAKSRNDGLKIEGFDAYDIGLITDSNYLNSSPLEESKEKIRENLGNHNDIAAVTGYIGKDGNDDITLLGGRGCSDFSGTYIGAALDADEIQIWTDRFFSTADPKKIRGTKIIRGLDYDEAEQLAAYGAKILHSKSIEPAKEKNIPLVVKNTFERKDKGTIITDKKEVHKNIVKSITSKEVYVVHVTSKRAFAPGLAAHFFGAFEHHKVSIDMIYTSTIGIACTVDAKNGNYNILEQIISEVRKYDPKSTTVICGNKTQVNIIGHGIRKDSCVAAKVFSSLNSAKISYEGISEENGFNFGLVFDNKDGLNAVKAIHKSYFG